MFFIAQEDTQRGSERARDLPEVAQQVRFGAATQT